MFADLDDLARNEASADAHLGRGVEGSRAVQSEWTRRRWRLDDLEAIVSVFANAQRSANLLRNPQRVRLVFDQINTPPPGRLDLYVFIGDGGHPRQTHAQDE